MLLDMDGTLVDTEELWWQAVADTALDSGRVLLESDRPYVFGQSIEHTAAYLGGDASLEAELEAAFLALVAADLVVLPGARELLALLRECGIPAALVSASPRSVMDVVVAVLGREWFEHSVAAGETARTKPHPDPYLAAAAHLGVLPSECLAVEDSPTGIASASAAGARVVLAPAARPADGLPQVDSLAGLDLAFLQQVMR